MLYREVTEKVFCVLYREVILYQLIGWNQLGTLEARVVVKQDGPGRRKLWNN